MLSISIFELPYSTVTEILKAISPLWRLVSTPGHTGRVRSLNYSRPILTIHVWPTPSCRVVGIGLQAALYHYYLSYLTPHCASFCPHYWDSSSQPRRTRFPRLNVYWYFDFHAGGCPLPDAWPITLSFFILAIIHCALLLKECKQSQPSSSIASHHSTTHPISYLIHCLTYYDHSTSIFNTASDLLVQRQGIESE